MNWRGLAVGAVVVSVITAVEDGRPECTVCRLLDEVERLKLPGSMDTRAMNEAQAAELTKLQRAVERRNAKLKAARAQRDRFARALCHSQNRIARPGTAPAMRPEEWAAAYREARQLLNNTEDPDGN